ncbi:MAG: NAD-dependent epimerase/dehydratase family protein [bacterium]|jgi:nucleoside-diphosphate-sugar epimerase
MKVLLAGGSGRVASLVTPFLAQNHTLRVLDRRPPQDGSVEYLEGNLTDPEALRQAVQGMDALIYLAMGIEEWESWEGIGSAYDVNIKALHFLLKTAAEAGITQAVYCSSMSVYSDLYNRYFPDEEIAPDETALYGFTKWLGEEVCRNASRRWGMNVNALRLCHPTLKARWLEQTQLGTPTIATTDEDVASAMDAALSLQAGFQAFMISGDYEQKTMSLAKASRMLGWAPQSRPVGS